MSKLDLFSNAKQFTFAPHRVRKKISAQNQITRPIETKLEELLLALYYLNHPYNLQF